MYKNEATNVFFQACEEGDVGSAQAALSAGANVNEVDPLTEQTVLHRASLHHRVKTVEFLLANGADPNARDDRGRTPLFCALDYGEENGREENDRAETVGALISGGSEVDAVRVDGITVLHAASRLGRTQVVATLLDKGADIDRRDCRGRTAVQMAAETGQTDTVVELLNRGADLSAASVLGSSALDTATYYGNEDTAHVIRAHMEARELDRTLPSARETSPNRAIREDLGAPDPRPVKPRRPRL